MNNLSELEGKKSIATTRDANEPNHPLLTAIIVVDVSIPSPLKTPKQGTRTPAPL